MTPTTKPRLAFLGAFVDVERCLVWPGIRTVILESSSSHSVVVRSFVLGMKEQIQSLCEEPKEVDIVSKLLNPDVYVSMCCCRPTS